MRPIGPQTRQPHGTMQGDIGPRALPHVLSLLMDHVWLLPRRIRLETPEPDLSVPLLRGVWGKQIHDRYPQLYSQIFDVPSRPGPIANSPLYILRPAPPDPEWAPAIEMILLGGAIDHAEELMECWEAAGESGIGRNRTPYRSGRVEYLRPDGAPSPVGGSWPLSAVRWPLPPDAPCRLVFPFPLRLISRQKLVTSPTLADLIASFNRRLGGFLPQRYQPFWREVGRTCLELARETEQQPWQGERLDLVRYSGRQKRDLEMRGVTGSLLLPRGPGAIAPLLAAMPWLHVGKGAVMGLGHVLVAPVE